MPLEQSWRILAITYAQCPVYFKLYLDYLFPVDMEGQLYYAVTRLTRNLLSMFLRNHSIVLNSIP